MRKLQPLLLSVSSGILLWASWPVSPFTFLIFIALVPFLFLEYRSRNRLTFFFHTFLAMLIWNAGTTWWICNSTVPGGIAAIIANSLLMCIPWLGFYNVKRRLGETLGYIAMVAFWMTFEYIHLNWQLSWPWLTLGNVFASRPAWVQWYEYTGTSGGTLWILVANILIFQLVKKTIPQPGRKHNGFSFKDTLAVILTMAVPLLLSITKPTYKAPPGMHPQVLVVQPNIDPYEKFQPGSQEAQLQLLIRLTESAIDTNTAVVVWPETAINSSYGIEETNLKLNAFLMPVWEFLRRHPRLKLLTGIESFRFFNEENKTPMSRRLRDSHQYYETYNTAGLLDSTGALQLYHKSKLVPGVETLPPFLRFIDSWFEEFGGTTSGYATQKERTVLTDSRSGLRFAPAICYESIYGEFFTEYFRNGANAIAIITNDGWWANTSGHKQHLQYARLRALETRCWVVRSANTGISCFISPAGQIFDPQPWDTAAAIKMNIPPSDELTFYVKHGDVISRIAIGAALIILLLSIFAWWQKRFLRKPNTWIKQ